MKRIFLLIFICCVSLQNINAQKSKLDSLRKALITANDTGRVNTLIVIAREHFHVDPDSSLIYIEKAKELTTDLEYLKGQKEVNICFSIYQFLKNDFDKSIEFAQKVLTIKGPGFTLEFDGDAYTLIANGYLRKNMYDKALNAYHLALGIYEKMKTDRKIAMVENNIGNIFYEQNRYKEASAYYLKSIEKRTRLGVEKELITPYNNLGNCFNAISDYKKALHYQEKALAISLKINSPFNIASCYQDIGAIYFGMDDLKKSREYKQKALDIFRNTDYLIDATSCYLGIGEVYAAEKNFKIALSYMDSARVIADSTDFTFNRHLVYKNLAGVYKLMGNFKQALTYSEMTAVLKDSLVNEEKNKGITEMQAKYESEKKDIEILVQKAEVEKQNTQRNGFVIGSGLLLMLSLFILRSFYQKKKDNRIITIQKIEVEKQKTLVEESRKELIDSIHYAERIQKTLMPSEKSIEKNMNRLKK